MLEKTDVDQVFAYIWTVLLSQWNDTVSFSHLNSIFDGNATEVFAPISLADQQVFDVRILKEINALFA